LISLRIFAPGGQQNAAMTDKQERDNIMTPVQNYNTLLLYDSQITLGQYLCFNLFRIIRPICRKYKLTINAVLILNAIVIYHKHVSSMYSFSGMRNFYSYYNTNKFGYYHKLLLDKGYVIQSDILNGNPRYKISELGIEVVKDIDEYYNRSLLKFISDYSLKD
jgi:hypothetical protein